MEEYRKTEGLWSIVMVELTSCCNFSCSFCPSDSMKRKKTVMPRELWEKVLRELGEKKMTKTVFFHLMGEPLLHEDVFDAIRFANEQGLSVSLYTNGALLDEDRAEKLLNALKKGRVVLSLQDIVPGSFDKRCHGMLSWDDYLKRLQEFMKKAEALGKSVQVHCLTNVGSMGWNLSLILREQKKTQKVYDQWHEALGSGKRCRINILNPAFSYPLGKNISFFVKHMGTWDNRHISDEMEVRLSDKGFCEPMTDTFAVLADGTCTYCCCDYEGELDLGSAWDFSLEDIYYGKKASEIREAGKKGIMINERCKVCRGKLVYKKTQKPVLKRNLIAGYYFFKDHLKRYGLKSAIRKVFENLERKS